MFNEIIIVELSMPLERLYQQQQQQQQSKHFPSLPLPVWREPSACRHEQTGTRRMLRLETPARWAFCYSGGKGSDLTRRSVSVGPRADAERRRRGSEGGEVPGGRAREPEVEDRPADLRPRRPPGPGPLGLQRRSVLGQGL